MISQTVPMDVEQATVRILKHVSVNQDGTLLTSLINATTFIALLSIQCAKNAQDKSMKMITTMIKKRNGTVTNANTTII